MITPNIKYDQILYNSGPITFSDFVNNKYEKIHMQLYRNALQKYLNEHQEYMLYKSAYNFIEIRQPEYWQASYVNIISKTVPHTRNVVWLNDYWCKYQNKDENTNNNYASTYIDEDTMKDAEVIDINYVTGEATMWSRFTDVKFKVPFNKLDKTTPVSNTLLSL